MLDVRMFIEGLDDIFIVVEGNTKKVRIRHQKKIGKLDR
jgi:hypothetical protein